MTDRVSPSCQTPRELFHPRHKAIGSCSTPLTCRTIHIELMRAVRVRVIRWSKCAHRVNRESSGARTRACFTHPRSGPGPHEEDAGLHCVRGAENISENSDVPSTPGAVLPRHATRANWRVSKTRWCVLRWPSPSMARAPAMSTEASRTSTSNVCTMDYARMARAMVPLERRMKRANRVTLKAGHEPHFSIKGMRRKCARRPQYPRRRKSFPAR